jgi:uncharacterized protein YciW
MQYNNTMTATETFTFTFTAADRAALAEALAEAIEQNRDGAHAAYLNTLQHTRPGTELPIDHELADALTYFGIREF